MKVLVTYHSDSGNTKKLAQAIYEGVTQAEKEILPFEETKDLETYDLIFCGFPVHSHSIPASAEKFLKGIPKDNKIALFATHGSLRGGQLAVTAFYHALSLASKGTVLGTFGCRGKVKSSLIDALMKRPEDRAWAMEARSAASHPDEADLEDGREFARLMLSKARSME
jgi:flavodoxin